MNLIEQLGLGTVLHSVSQALIVPTIIVLLALIAYAAYAIGSLVMEVVTERRHYKVAVPALLAQLDEAPFERVDDVVRNAGLLDTQCDALLELSSYLYLPEDARAEVARRLLADESERYQKALGFTDAAVKIAPMLGLMGTLIPLGPGIVALSAGDLEMLSSALLTAFDTTVAGLIVAVALTCCCVRARLTSCTWFRLLTT